jgi:hypothetical protein
MKKITLSLLLILLTTVAMAQPNCYQNGPHPGHGQGSWGPPGGAHGGPGMMGGGDMDHREMRDAFRLFKLTQYLELDESQTVVIYPRIAAMNNARDEHRELMREKMDELKELLDKDKQKQAAKLATEIHGLKLKQISTHHEQVTEIMSQLNDEQLAKFVLFERGFQKHMQGVQKKIAKRRMGPSGKTGEPGQRDGSGRRGR